jgi:hypothetical protein
MSNEPVFLVGGSPSKLPGRGWINVGVYDGATWQDDPTDEPLYLLRVQLARRDDGQLICTGLLFGGDNEHEVTARALRGISMSALLRSLSREEQLHKRNEEWPLNSTRAGSKGLPLSHFEEVARGYREALQEAPKAPVKNLAERWHHPEATIRTWLKQARDRGLLGAATHGKAGEKPLPPKTRRKK